MCGIFGYAGPECDAAKLIFSSLKDLEYRGYDSWGIALKRGAKVTLEKQIGKLQDRAPSLGLSSLGVGHTRWATTGAVTQENAHPHSDCSGRIAVVHNGIVENYGELRVQLAGAHTFRSETDTEIIAHLLEEELSTDPAPTLALALRRVSRRLHGLNAVAAMDVATGELAVYKSGSPLYVGISDHAHFIASDPSALLRHTKKVLWIEDGQTASIRSGGVELFDAETGRLRSARIETIGWQAEEAERGTFSHFMEKEMMEQAPLLRRIARSLTTTVQDMRSFLEERPGAILTGCGSAYHAAMLGAAAFQRFTRIDARAVLAHELDTVENALATSSVVALSQSGETIDLLEAVRRLRRRDVPVAALVNVPGSGLTRETSPSLAVGAGPERCVLATKSFTAKVAYLFAIACGDDAHAAEMLTAAADEMSAMMIDGRISEVEKLAAACSDAPSMFVVGSGIWHPAALEGALKIKEVSYIHAEGFAAAELKHGVIALVENGTPCFVFVPGGPAARRALVTAGELKARGAKVIGIGPDNDAVFDVHLAVRTPDWGALFPAGFLLQQLAYRLAVMRGNDPDRPRNLAKSVTVR